MAKVSIHDVFTNRNWLVDACQRDIAEKQRLAAVNKAIDASNRSGRKISKGEAKAIHRLLRGRT